MEECFVRILGGVYRTRPNTRDCALSSALLAVLTRAMFVHALDRMKQCPEFSGGRFEGLLHRYALDLGSCLWIARPAQLVTAVALYLTRAVLGSIATAFLFSHGTGFWTPHHRRAA